MQAHWAPSWGPMAPPWGARGLARGGPSVDIINLKVKSEDDHMKEYAALLVFSMVSGVQTPGVGGSGGVQGIPRSLRSKFSVPL